MAQSRSQAIPMDGLRLWALILLEPELKTSLLHPGCLVVKGDTGYTANGMHRTPNCWQTHGLLQ